MKCIVCNKRKARKNGKKCQVCVPSGVKRKLDIKLYKHPHFKYKKDKCDKCGFVALHACQLDVDHIDGNHSNNDPTNLQTLCANCHRLKTQLNKDYLNKTTQPCAV